MQLQLTLAPGDISIIERFLPHLATRLNIAGLSQNNILLLSREELKNLQVAVVDVLAAYGFDENYELNAVGKIAENLIDNIQRVLDI